MATKSTSYDPAALVEDAERALREGAYVAVGLGVLGFQRAQVRRRELARRFEGSDLGRLLDGLDPTALWSQLPDAPLGDVTATGKAQFDEVSDRLGANLAGARAQLTDVVRSVDERVAPTRRQLEEQVEALEERLPAGARDLVDRFRKAVEAPEARIRAAVGLD